MAFIDHDKLIGIAELAGLTGKSEEALREEDADGKLPRRVESSKGRKWRQRDIDLWQAAGHPDRATFEASEAFKRIDGLRQQAADAAERAAFKKEAFKKAAAEVIQSAKTRTTAPDSNSEPGENGNEGNS